MKKILKNLMALTLGLSLVAFAACSGDDDNGGDPPTPPAVPEITGTYTGDIYAGISGIVDSTFTNQTFKVSESNGKTTLSLTLTIPVGGASFPMPISVDLVNLTTVNNGTITVEDDESGGTLTGTLFNMAPYSLTIPVVGGTIALKGAEVFGYNGAKFDGYQGNISDPDGDIANAFGLAITGTASGGMFPAPLPVEIGVEGIKK